MEWKNTQSKEGNLTGKSRLRRMISGLPFSVKVIVHIVIVILLTGTTITSIITYQYQKELYRREYEQALTVYTAGVNYFVAHYYSHGESFVSKNLDFVLGSRFMQLEGNDAPQLSMHPKRIFLYDPDGMLIYQYAREPDKPLSDQVAPVVMRDFKEWQEVNQDLIHVAGPLRSRDEVIGYIHVTLSTTIEFHRVQMFQQTMGVASMIGLFSMLLSMLFARNVLAPILSLTRAARKIRQGDLHQTVPVKTEDEIGVLSATFNDMVENLGTRIQLMHRLQAETVRISRELDREKLLDTLADIFTRLSGSSGYRLYLYNEATDTLEPKTETGTDLLPQAQMDRLSQLAFEERWTQYLKETGAMDSEPGRVLETAIPMLSGQHRVGVIRIGPRNDEAYYDDETLTILQTLAQHASVSLDNTELLSRVAAQQRIEQEMQLARLIQQAMLPDTEPDIPGYSICGKSIAALEVGGDYFDYVESIDGHYHFILGDVSGKGVPAAFIMSIVRSLVHTFSEMDSSPLDVLRKLNRRVTQDIEPEMFVTMAAIDLNPATHEVRIVRAGHEPVLCLKKNGAVSRISPRGTAVGLLEPETFESLTEMETHAIEEGDTLLLFTDGVTEARNTEGEEYGMERLEALLAAHATLAPQDLFELIQKEVMLFAKGVQQLDDITLLMLHRNPRPGGY